MVEFAKAFLAKILESPLKVCDSFFLQHQRVCKMIKSDYVFSHLLNQNAFLGFKQVIKGPPKHDSSELMLIHKH